MTLGRRRLVTPDTADADESEPTDVVDTMLAAHRYVTDENGRTYSYANGHWSPVTDFVLMARVKAASGGRIRKRSAQEAIVHQVGIETLKTDLEWHRAADHEVPCASGMLDLRTMRARPHNPDDFLDSALPHEFDPTAACPTWDRVLEEWFGDADADGIASLQQFLGYVLTSGNNQKRAGLLVGPGDAGKSVVIDIARHLVGLRNVCTLPPAAMDDPTRLAIIEGKRLNVVAEISNSAIFRDGGFKALVAGDPILINPKFKPPFSYVPPTKHLIACNDLPVLTGRTDEIFNRFLIVPMVRTVPPDKRDSDLRRKLVAELPGIFAWAIRGAQDLVAARWRFTETGGRDDLLERWRLVSTPARAFLMDYLMEAPGKKVPLSQIVERMRSDWGRNTTPNDVGKTARELGLTVKKARVEGSAGVMCILDHTLRSRGGLADGPNEG